MRIERTYMSDYYSLNKNVFSSFLKPLGDEMARIFSGKLFQVVAPNTGKDLAPICLQVRATQSFHGYREDLRFRDVDRQRIYPSGKMVLKGYAGPCAQESAILRGLACVLGASVVDATLAGCVRIVVYQSQGVHHYFGRVGHVF